MVELQEAAECGNGGAPFRSKATSVVVNVAYSLKKSVFGARLDTSSISEQLQDGDVWVLGQKLCFNRADGRQSPVQSAISSLFWFTYRRDFDKPIANSWYIYDTGWGCMLRTSQMLLAETLTRWQSGRHLGRGGLPAAGCLDAAAHDVTTTLTDSAISSSSSSTSCTDGSIGSSSSEGNATSPSTDPAPSRWSAGLSWMWSASPPSAQTAQAPSATHPSCRISAQTYRKVLRLFRDSADAQFSIHNIATAGTLFDKPVGSWFGPTTACLALQHVVSSWWKRLGADSTDRDDAAAADDPSGALFPFGPASGPGGAPPLLPFAVHVAEMGTVYAKDVAKAAKVLHKNFSTASNSWRDMPVLVLVPIMLGFGAINPVYVPSLLAALHLPHCVGIMGGRPNYSLYFIGHQESLLLCLDPHELIQSAYLHDTSSNSQGSVHMDGVRTLPAASLDPSLALGFFFHNHEDWLQFVQESAKLRAVDPPLFTLVEATSSSSSQRRSPGADFDVQNSLVLPSLRDG